MRAIVVSLMLAASAASATVTARSDFAATFGTFKKVAVAPLDCAGMTIRCDSSVDDEIYRQFRAAWKPFTVAPKAVAQARIDLGLSEITQQTAPQLAAALGVDAIVVSRVVAEGEDTGHLLRAQKAPVATIRLQIFSADGKLLAEGQEGGGSFMGDEYTTLTRPLKLMFAELWPKKKR